VIAHGLKNTQKIPGKGMKSGKTDRGYGRARMEVGTEGRPGRRDTRSKHAERGKTKNNFLRNAF